VRMRIDDSKPFEESFPVVRPQCLCKCKRIPVSEGHCGEAENFQKPAAVQIPPPWKNK
jgi:hypothetical protein